MIRIEDWSLGVEGDAYLPPEAQKMRLHGKVYGHPRQPDGKEVTTSSIISIEGKTVLTRHNEYTLGKPSYEYVEWCKENKVHVPTEEEPIRIKELC